ncbi:MetQ/NlpA family ABC transporter substrate-binding protein [Pseudobdellovibrio exovorus]|nr:MetQ/NlpA family ABC transporter substrate-binding protein [Pseudobdellovibrio exovorus]
MKWFSFTFGVTALFLTSTTVQAQTPSPAAKKQNITIGATVGDFADLVKHGLRPQLEKKGYKVKLVEFTDYVTPNLALAEGRLDANIFQHKPYLDQFAKEKGLKLSAVAQVPTAPLGLYAGKLKSLDEVKEESKIAIPNDATNLSRALTILSDLGWVEISKNANPLLVGTKDITKNPKKLKIVLLEAAQLPRALADVDYAVINGNYATSAGMALTSALTQEKSDLYVNWAVVTEKNKDSVFTKDLVEVLNSEELKKYANTKFKGYKFPTSWKK